MRCKKTQFKHKARFSSIRRRMIRYCYVVVDLSAAMGTADADMRPSRIHCVRVLLEQFVRRFFDDNPDGGGPTRFVVQDAIGL